MRHEPYAPSKPSTCTSENFVCTILLAFVFCGMLYMAGHAIFCTHVVPNQDQSGIISYTEK